MTTQERENYIFQNITALQKQQTELIKLLKAVSKSRDIDVLRLRKEVLKYVNSSERYIAHLEIDNFELSQAILNINGYTKKKVTDKKLNYKKLENIHKGVTGLLIENKLIK